MKIYFQIKLGVVYNNLFQYAKMQFQVCFLFLGSSLYFCVLLWTCCSDPSDQSSSVQPHNGAIQVPLAGLASDRSPWLGWPVTLPIPGSHQSHQPGGGDTATQQYTSADTLQTLSNSIIKLNTDNPLYHLFMHLTMTSWGRAVPSSRQTHLINNRLL